MRSFLLQRRHSWHPSSSNANNGATRDSKSINRRRYSLAANIGSDNSKFSSGNGYGRRYSLPFLPAHRRQPVQVGDVIMEEEYDEPEQETKERTMKFDTAITGDHLTKLIVLTMFVFVVTLSAVSYSFYNVLNKQSW